MVHLKLTQAELVRVTTWVDTNAQFYGSYWGRRNVQYKGYRNYRPLTTFEQAISINAPLPENQR